MDLPVWLYWEGEKPDWIKMCHYTVFNHASNAKLISPQEFETLRTTDTDIDLSGLCVAHRADFIRSFLLAKFGGIWIDADCLVMKSLLPLFELLAKYDFIGYRERSGFITNNFMGAPANSRIAMAYFQNICDILRSGQHIEWLTLGSHALTSTINTLGIEWYELATALIQPVCWSDPKEFFIKRDNKGHEEVLNKNSFCYMLSANMVNGFMKENPSESLLHDKSFFNFLCKKSKRNSILSKIRYRKNTDDDNWVIPEVIEKDMYRIQDELSLLTPQTTGYIIDCGAHIGAFSIMCSCYFPNMQVISFEPNPDSFQYLSENSKLFGKITAINKAVDTKEGFLNLFEPAQDEWTGRWSTIPNSNKYVSVESVDIFSYINSLSEPVFILKFDIEGYEEFILNNSKEEDLARIKILIVETHGDSFDHDKLASYGFKLLFRPEISSDRQFVYTR